MQEKIYSCIDCGVSSCSTRDGKNPPFCLTTPLTDAELAQLAALYQQEQERRISLAAAEVEAEHYCAYTRVEETIAFAKKMGMEKIGIAACVGLKEEARIFAQILRLNGFEAFGAVCKVGSMEKTAAFGFTPPSACPVGNVMCNPILQAKLMNEAKVDFAVVMGLCCGHDTLFYQYAEVPVTTLIVKDRVLGHNPVQALYQARAYYRKKLMEQPIEP